MCKITITAMLLSVLIMGHAEKGLAVATLPCSEVLNWSFQDSARLEYQVKSTEFYRELENLINKLKLGGKDSFRLWSNYLGLEDLLSLQNATVGAQLVGTTKLRRFIFARKESVEHRWFGPLRKLIDPYHDILNTINYGDGLRTEFDAKRAALFVECQNFNTEASRETRFKLQKIYHWFVSTGTVGQPLVTFFRPLLKPGLVLRLPESYVKNKMDQNLFKPSKTTSNVSRFSLPLGFRGKYKTVESQGTSHTQGVLTMTLLPSTETIRYRVEFKGQVTSKGFSSQGIVASRTDLEADVSATGTVDITLQGVQISPVETDVTINKMSNQVSNSIKQPLISQIVDRIASRKVNSAAVRQASSQQSRQAIASQLAQSFETEIRAFFNRNMGKIIPDNLGSELFSFEEAALVMARENLHLSQPVLASDYRSLYAQLEWDIKATLGAAEPCKLSFRPGQIGICIHESFLSNVFDRFFGSKDVPDTHFESFSKILFTQAPYELYTHTRKEKWWVVFEDVAPWSFGIESKDFVSIVLRVKGFWHKAPNSANRKYISSPHVFRARYHIGDNGYGRLNLERESFEIEGSKEGLENQDREFLVRMDKRLEAFFGEVIDMGGLNLPKGSKLHDTFYQLKVNDLRIDDGWLGFNLENFESLLPANLSF